MIVSSTTPTEAPYGWRQVVLPQRRPGTSCVQAEAKGCFERRQGWHGEGIRLLLERRHNCHYMSLLIRNQHHQLLIIFNCLIFAMHGHQPSINLITFDNTGVLFQGSPKPLLGTNCQSVNRWHHSLHKGIRESMSSEIKTNPKTTNSGPFRKDLVGTCDHRNT